MGDTTWAPQRRSRPRRHPCKGEREVRPSRRNRSRSSIRLKPFVQFNYPRAPPELLWRRPPCARESSCLRTRLPPWQDMTAESHVLGMLNGSYFSVPRYILASYRLSCYTLRGLRYSFDILPPAWVDQTRILLTGEWGHCPQGHPRFLSVTW